jgi:hypothetical protein
MLKPMPWLGRSFHFGLEVGAFPMVIERLRGTHARAAELVNGVPEATLSARHQGAWSVKEHIGHLADLDELDQKRLDEFLARTPTLSAADMSNRKTDEAEHAQRPIWILLDQLRDERARLVGRLEALGPEEVELTARHPRLGVSMRVIDWAQFVAEHDDHHLAHARWVLSALRDAAGAEATTPAPGRVSAEEAAPRR